MTDRCQQLNRDGYVFIRQVFSRAEVEAVLHSWHSALTKPRNSLLTASSGDTYGARNLLDFWPEVCELLRCPPLNESLREVLGPTAGIVRGLFFDKPPGQSWSLPFHKDFTIAVRAHGAIGIFTRPTLKAGVPHVHAPRSLLEQMLTARIHLDPMSEANGALRVVPGSHTGDESRPALTLECQAGDVLLMRPLLTHGSGEGHPGNPQHRRIVHLECTPSHTLPGNYDWRWYRDLAVPFDRREMTPIT